MERAAVVSIFKATDDAGNFTDAPILDIVFRQAFHDLGLAMSFNFTKSYVAPFGTCDLTIENINNNIAEAFAFDVTTYARRPLVQIRAGYSAELITQKSEIGNLKNSLPVIYSGHPFYAVDQKIVGGRNLTVNLSDVSTGFLQGKNSRVCEWFRKGQKVTDVLKFMLDQIGGYRYDLSALLSDPATAALTLPSDVFYNNLPILPTVVPNLGREFRFWSTTDASGIAVFRPSKQRPPTQAFDIVSAETGMIEHPTKVNWTHWSVKTLFGRPKVFFPGEWIQTQASFVNSSNAAFSGVVTGCVINADYNWDDESATASYVIAPEGEPVSANPVLQT